MRTNVIQEIMDTERVYIKHLRDICEVSLGASWRRVTCRAAPPRPARPSAHACSWSPIATPARGPCTGHSLTRCWSTLGSVSGRPSAG